MPDNETLTSQAEALLASTGGRRTRQRVTVLAALLASTGPRSHAELELAVPELDRVTLYRVLSWLEQQGLVHRLTGEDRIWRFGLRKAGNHSHPHFHCVDCGATRCLDGATPAPALPPGFRAERVTLVVEGHCEQCVEP